MHGSICVILKKFIEQNYGAPTWREILRLAGHDELVLSPIQTYPDDVVMTLVGVTCEHLEIDLETALTEVGKFAAPELIRFAKGMLHPDWKSFEVLANVETLIHRTIRVSNPGAEPASIQAFQLSESEMQVIYSSRRGLCALAKGILEGLGPVFDEDITVTENTCCQKGDPFCTFTMNRVATEGNELAGNADQSGGMIETSAADPQSDPYAATTMLGSSSSDSSREDSKHQSFSEADAGHHSEKQNLPLPDRFGRYSVSEIIGYGGMGVVYRAVDETLERVVAIKTIKSPKTSQKKQDQFFAEARRLARLDHPNVVRIYDVGKVGNRPYFVMEYLEGSTLSRRISKGPVSVKVASKIFKQLVDGLHAIHQIGMVHRDIKPGNIILSRDANKCALLDFGLSDDETDSRLPSTSRAVSGTLGYLPPERLRGLPGDYRGDFFSLGCVGYELFSGKMIRDLKQFQNPKELSLRDIEETQAWTETPESLREIIVGMLEPDPQKRLCDYETIMSQLDHCLVKIL